MKTNFAVLLADKQIKMSFWVTILIMIVFVIIAIWKWSSLPPQLPLFYSLPRSTDQLATPSVFLLLPVFTAVFSFFNFYMAALLYAKERLASVILTIMSITVSFLLLVTFLKIVFLVS